jgi:PAS domain S-box-containing protein
MFRSLPVAAVLSRFPDGTIVDCNDAFVALTGYAREEIVGKTSIEAGLVRDVAARQRALDSVERVGAVRNVDLTYYTKTGEPREIVTNVNVIELQGTRYVLSSVADITERKRAEEAVRRAMEFDEAVMSNMGEGLYTVDSQGLVTSMNPMAERLFGWTLEELRGRRMHDVTHYKHPDGSPFPAEECAGFQVLRQGRTLTDYEDVFIRRDGTFFDVVYSSSPLTHGDTITGLVVVFRDITDRKRAQEALRASEQRARRMAASAETANRLKDQFLATLSHELRTPLNAILGCARMLRMDAVPPLKRDRAVQIIERNAILQTQLVEDLLDISRITNGEIRLEMKKLPAAAPLREAIENVTPTAEASRVGLDTNIDPAAGDITGDPRRLQQVFWNLLSNAVKFTPEGGLVAVSLQSERGTIVVSVRDTGIGISSEFLPYIFEPFRQAGGGVSRQFGGLGLGLAICKRLIDLHAGSLTVESAGTGQGATFTVRLPRHIPSRVASDDSADGGEETTERRDGTHEGRPFRA